MLNEIMSAAPNFVGENGCKFWLDIDLTRYARNKGLATVRVLVAQEANGNVVRLIYEGEQPIYESQTLEDIGCHIDIMAVIASPSP